MSDDGGLERVEPQDRAQWAAWMSEHHATSPGVWVRLDDRRAPGDQAHSYENAVLEALRWGWVDGQTRRDGDASLIRFTPRRATSGWAGTNKARIARLRAAGLLEAPGRAAVERAEANGTWSVLDGPEAGVEPDLLRSRLDATPEARLFWDALPATARRFALTQIAFAKREDTRERRIDDVVRRCAAGERPDR